MTKCCPVKYEYSHLCEYISNNLAIFIFCNVGQLYWKILKTESNKVLSAEANDNVN